MESYSVLNSNSNLLEANHKEHLVMFDDENTQAKPLKKKTHKNGLKLNLQTIREIQKKKIIKSHQER